MFGIPDVLTAILCLLSMLANIIEGAVVAVINALIVSLAGWVSLLALLLPGMPDRPSGPPPEVVQWFNWFFPTAAFLVAFWSVVGIWLTVLAIRWVLRLSRVL